MLYLTSKFRVNRLSTFGFMEGGGGGVEAPPPQAQELQKSPDGIGVKHTKTKHIDRQLRGKRGKFPSVLGFL